MYSFLKNILLFPFCLPKMIKCVNMHCIWYSIYLPKTANLKIWNCEWKLKMKNWKCKWKLQADTFPVCICVCVFQCVWHSSSVQRTVGVWTTTRCVTSTQTALKKQTRWTALMVTHPDLHMYKYTQNTMSQAHRTPTKFHTVSESS